MSGGQEKAGREASRTRDPAPTAIISTDTRRGMWFHACRPDARGGERAARYHSDARVYDSGRSETSSRNSRLASAGLMVFPGRSKAPAEADLKSLQTNGGMAPLADPRLEENFTHSQRATRDWLWAGLLLAIVFLICNLPIVIGTGAPQWDASELFAPNFTLIADHARAGRIVLWDPWVSGGVPDYAEPEPRGHLARRDICRRNHGRHGVGVSRLLASDLVSGASRTALAGSPLASSAMGGLRRGTGLCLLRLLYRSSPTHQLGVLDFSASLGPLAA